MNWAREEIIRIHAHRVVLTTTKKKKKWSKTVKTNKKQKLTGPSFFVKKKTP